MPAFFQDQPKRQKTGTEEKIRALHQELGITPGDGFCSRLLGERALALFNAREVAKLDIESARLEALRLRWCGPKLYRAKLVGTCWD